MPRRMPSARAATHTSLFSLDIDHHYAENCLNIEDLASDSVLTKLETPFHQVHRVSEGSSGLGFTPSYGNLRSRRSRIRGRTFESCRVHHFKRNKSTFLF